MHLLPFCLPFDNEGYHTLTGFIFLKCHLAMISMTACFIQRSIKPLEKTQERISACERQSWGRGGTKRLFFYFILHTGRKRTNPPLPPWSLFDDWCHLQYFYNPLDSTTFQSEWKYHFIAQKIKTFGQADTASLYREIWNEYDLLGLVGQKILVNNCFGD